jgi:hypothetical protein
MDPDPAFFVFDLQDDNKNLSFFSFLTVHLHNFSKIKSHQEVTKQLESRFFLPLMIEGSGSVPFDYRIRIQEAQKRTDPTDPQHCLLVGYNILFRQHNAGCTV